MKTAFRFLAGFLIALASHLLALTFDSAYGWLCGWVGATVYFNAVALPKWWNR